jgi:hypothetical protein
VRWRLRPSREPVATGLFERAAARFSASEAGHTAARLTVTLGAPRVSVGASAGAAQEVRITVAWELCWYQWGVDLADPARPVFELGKGEEVSELDAAARHWNGELRDGRVVLTTRPQPPSPVVAIR